MNKGIIRLIAICIISGMLLNSIPVLASENTDSFAALAAEENLMALVYGADEVPVYRDDSISEVSTYLESGHTVYVEGISLISEGYYKITFYKNASECSGYIDGRNLAYSNENWIKWEQENLEVFDETILSATDYSDINSFPSDYQTKLLELKKQHQNWTFVPVKTKLDFDTAVTNEMGDKSWIYYTDSNKNNGYLGESTSQKNWYYATQKAVEHYMDPRNYLDETRIFAFEQLTYNASYHTEEAVQSFLNGTFMKGEIPNEGMTYAQAFYNIGKSRKLSPTHLASRVYQEQGKGTSALISGTYSGYEGYYNYFNIGATGTSSAEVIKNGLAYAKNKGWDSRYKSLEGGAAAIGNNYVLRGQDTSYLQKFNVGPDAASATYTHQYMQNIQAPYTESSSTCKMYSGAGSLSGAFVFKIPVFENMPGSSEPSNPDPKPDPDPEPEVPADPSKEDLTKKKCSVSFMKADGVSSVKLMEVAYGYELTEGDFPAEEELLQTDSEMEFVGFFEKITKTDGTSDLGTAYKAGSAVIHESTVLIPCYEKKGMGFLVVPVGNFAYTGTRIKPEITLYDSTKYTDADGSTVLSHKKLTLGRDYTVSYANNLNAASKDNSDTGKRPAVIIKGKGNYSGTQYVYFDITKKSINDVDIEIEHIYTTYTGGKISSVPVIYDKNTKLKKNKDFTVSYQQLDTGSYVNVGTWTVTVTGINNYEGTASVYQTITKKTLISEAEAEPVSNQSYDDFLVDIKSGKGIEPAVKLYYDGKTLVNCATTADGSGDYTVTYKNNTCVGTAKAIVTASSNSKFSGRKVITFKITGTNIKNARVKSKQTGYEAGAIVNKKYSSDKSLMLQDGYKLYFGDKELTESTDGGKTGDYIVSYLNTDKVGTATICFKGVNGYTGTLKKTYKITADNLTEDGSIRVTMYSSYQYVKGGVKVLPEVSFTEKSTGKSILLEKDKDYKLSYKNVNAVSEAGLTAASVSISPTVTIVGKGNYTGSFSQTFKITKGDLAGFVQKYSVSDNGTRGTIYASDVIYSEKSGGFKSSPVLTDVSGSKLSAGKDYSKKYVYRYVNDTDLNGDGLVDKLAGSEISAEDILPAGTEVSLTVKGLDSANASISGTADASGAVGTSASGVVGTSVSSAVGASASGAASASASGAASASASGAASAFGTVSVGNNYNDAELTCTYRVTKRLISDKKITATISAKEYTGRQIRPDYNEITVDFEGQPLIAGKDYEIVAYNENVNKGKGSVTIRGLGDFGGIRKITFTIRAKSIFW